MTGPARPEVVLVEFSPSGGLFQFALQLGEALGRRGHKVEVLTGPRPELPSREERCVLRPILPTWHPTAGSDSPEWWRRARRFVRAGQLACAWVIVLVQVATRRPNVVLFSTWRFALDAWFVQLLARLAPGVQLGIIAHEPRPLVEQPGAEGLYKKDRVLDRALRGAWSKMDVAFVLGETTRTELLANWPLRCPVTVIPHGDEAIFIDGSAPPVTETEPRALFFGTITAYKGLDDLLEAWPQIHAALPLARLTIAGSVGADVDAEKLAERVAAMPGVTLQAGYVPVDAVAPLFGAARCVVLPYRRSSQSGVAHLAFTFARPVVATSVGDVPSVVRDGETGRLVAPGDVPALAAAVTALLGDAAESAQLGQQGHARLGNTASWDDVAGLVDTALQSVGHR